jgi:hypothetical protein
VFPKRSLLDDAEETHGHHLRIDDGILHILYLGSPQGVQYSSSGASCYGIDATGNVDFWWTLTEAISIKKALVA